MPKKIKTFQIEGVVDLVNDTTGMCKAGHGVKCGYGSDIHGSIVDKRPDGVFKAVSLEGFHSLLYALNGKRVRIIIDGSDGVDDGVVFESDVASIQGRIKQYVFQNFSTNIIVDLAGCEVLLKTKEMDAASKHLLIKARNKVIAYVIKHFDHRYWSHVHGEGGKAVWELELGGVGFGWQCGIRMHETNLEKAAMMAGRDTWTNIQVPICFTEGESNDE